LLTATEAHYFRGAPQLNELPAYLHWVPRPWKFTFSAATGQAYWDFTDWLGTERARAATGAVVETCTSLPWGDNQVCTGTDESPLHFTGKERDSESGLDNFEAR
jgi:hypothetical protein